MIIQSLLINGRGKFNCSTPGIEAGVCNATNPDCSLYSMTVVPGKTYRLRIGSLTSLSALSFEIEVFILPNIVPLKFRCGIHLFNLFTKIPLHFKEKEILKFLSFPFLFFTHACVFPAVSVLFLLLLLVVMTKKKLM